MPEQTIKLISADGYTFVVDYDAACVSNTVKNMLSSAGSFMETEQGEIKFPEITAEILERVCQYMYYKWMNQNAKDVPQFEIPERIALQLLMAANYLDI